MVVELDNIAVNPPVGDPVRAQRQRIDDLGEIVLAYNQVTENLRLSHESLREEVLRLQRELASTDAQLQRSKRLAALGEMAAGIAHEIRNPLAAIQLYANMLVEDLGIITPTTPTKNPNTKNSGLSTEKVWINPPRTEESLSNAHKIADAVHGLNAIVNDVLSFAREIVPEPCRVFVEQLFDRAIDSHCPAINKALINVAVEIFPADLTVQVDPELVHQALLNTIRNAVEAMSTIPGTDRSLILKAREDDGYVVLAVHDTGPGIRSENIDRIFNPFFTTRNTGTGLGLAIVHRIVDAHGGAISVHNDCGAVFELRWPIITVNQIERLECSIQERLHE